MYVFAYGSLLDPASLARTLPGVDAAACVPARLAGFTRSFSVAFRNDGTHRDKSYVDARGAAPPVVLFCDLTPQPGARVNGICVPVDEAALAALYARELRYAGHDVTASVTPVEHNSLDGPVHTFLGREIHRSPADVATGVVADHYLASVLAGAAHWERVMPGFLDEFTATTRLPEQHAVRALTRIDAPRHPDSQGPDRRRPGA